MRSLGLIQSDYRKDQVNLDEKAEQAKENAKLAGYVKDQQTFLQKRIDVINDNLSSLETTRRLFSKLLKEVEEQRQTWSLKDYYEFVRIKGNALLSYEIKKLEDESVLTLGKVILALLYLIFGFTLAGYISRLFGRIVLSRFGVDEGASSAIQALSYYVLLIIVFMMSFNAVNISLTAFAFLGGALAIGIGFGSQNILSNFISGLILLVERPIKVGDLIEVDGTSGTVKRIGARCTQVLTFSNVDMLVPNSKFLESKVVNLTHGDKIIRKEITVGVAYGSNPREVSKLIKKIIDEHGLILRHPEPYVLFNNFGDNCLEFEARFWVNLGSHNALIIMSDIRHRINSLFEEAGIVIAFPQRDVHLDTLSPLEIRLVKDSGEQGGLQNYSEKE